MRGGGGGAQICAGLFLFLFLFSRGWELPCHPNWVNFSSDLSGDFTVENSGNKTRRISKVRGEFRCVCRCRFRDEQPKLQEFFVLHLSWRYWEHKKRNRKLPKFSVGNAPVASQNCRKLNWTDPRIGAWSRFPQVVAPKQDKGLEEGGEDDVRPHSQYSWDFPEEIPREVTPKQPFQIPPIFSWTYLVGVIVQGLFGTQWATPSQFSPLSTTSQDTPCVRLGLSAGNSGKTPEMLSEFSWNSPREYGCDPTSLIIQGIWGCQSISRILSPSVKLGTTLFSEVVPETPLRAGHGIPNSTEGISETSDKQPPEGLRTRPHKRVALIMVGFCSTEATINGKFPAYNGVSIYNCVSEFLLLTARVFCLQLAFFNYNWGVVAYGGKVV